MCVLPSFMKYILENCATMEIGNGRLDNWSIKHNNSLADVQIKMELHDLVLESRNQFTNWDNFMGIYLHCIPRPLNSELQCLLCS